MPKNWFSIAAICVINLFVVVYLVSWLGTASTAVAQTANHTVCPEGPPTCDFAVIQAAVDAAQPGDLIKVAAGVYNQFNAHGGLGQVVYLNKSVTLRGGYDNQFNEPPNPTLNPTIIDAQGQGRVIYITGAIAPTIEGFTITGGDVSEPTSPQYGGGVYILTATATIQHNQIVSNIARYGGAIHMSRSDAIMRHNEILSNTAVIYGGGLHLDRSPATIVENIIRANESPRGGGLYLFESGALIEENVIVHNRTSSTSATYGLGLYLIWSNAVIKNNYIAYNNAPGQGHGGGIYISWGAPTVEDNIILANSAGFGTGGGVMASQATVNLQRNTISANVAGYGGGVAFVTSGGLIKDNYIMSNRAIFVDGGGMVIVSGANPQLVNNIVAHNQAGNIGNGGGIFINNANPRLWHTTIAANNSGSGGHGVHIAGVSSVVFTNTILVGHTTGVAVAASGSVTMTATLWGSDAWANENDWSGAGTIYTGTINIWGPPAFVNPDTADFRIAGASAARDAGVNAGVYTDIHGQSRPFGNGFDLGADEYWGDVEPPTDFLYLPLIKK
jgi:hypothetical protein